MASTQITQSLQVFTDLTGQPLDAGYIYVGQANQNPETNPIAVYWDAELTQPAAQPLRTVSGYISRQGTPASIYAASSYSITVKTKTGTLVYYRPTPASDATLGLDLAASSGSSLVGFVQSGTGAVATTVQDELRRQPVTPEGYGALETFSLSQDDTAAVQAALNTGRPLKLNRLYRCTAGLTSAGQMISGNGTQTGFVFDGIGTGVNGITFTPTGAETTSAVMDCAIYVRGTNGGSAIKTPKSATQYDTLRSKFQFERLLIAGYEKPTSGANAFETTTGWTVGLDLGDAWNVGIVECDGYSTYRSDTNPSGQLQSTFIRLDAASAMLTAHISSITCANWYRGVEIGDRAFFQIQRFDIAHAYDGVYQIGTTPYNESKLLNGNINAQHWGVYFNGITTREIAGVVVRRHKSGWKGATYDWVGFNLPSCTGVWLTNCQAQPDESNGAFTGTQYGVKAVAASGLHCDGFLAGSTLDYGVYADNCVMVMVDNIMSWQANGATDVVVCFANNTRASYYGSYALVSTFSGSVFSTVGTVNSTNNIQSRNISLEGAQPSVSWRETDQAVGQKNWYDYVNAGVRGRAVRDDSDAGTVNYELITRSGTTVTQIEWRANNYKFASVPTYADETAATAGGLASGSIYKTSAGDLRIKL